MVTLSFWIIGVTAAIATFTATAWSGADSQYRRQAADAPMSKSFPKEQADRQARLSILKSKAQERMREDLALYSDSELRDIEARYRSAHLPWTSLHTKNARGILQELVRLYPRSN